MFSYFRFVCLLTFGVLITAGSELSAQVANPEIREVSFSALSWGRSIRDLFYQNASGDPVPLRIPNGAPSAAFEYRGTLPINFFRIVGEDAEGNPIRESAAVYQPRGNDQELILFVENPREQRGSYRIFSVPFAKESAPDNEYRFLNLSEFPVYVKFGQERFQVTSKSEKSVITAIPESGGQSIAMAIQVSEEPADVKIAYTSSWSVRDGRSALVFITRDMDSDDDIDVRTFYY